MVQYRSNVAALIIDQDGRVLICERASFRGAWQFPQGGVDEGESLEEALHREVEEEVGLSSIHYTVVNRRGGYRYLYPQDVRAKKLKKHGNHGQEQTYYLCEIQPDAPEINVHQKPREFRDYQWIQPQEFEINWLPKFKQDVYREVMWDFFKVTI